MSKMYNIRINRSAAIKLGVASVAASALTPIVAGAIEVGVEAIKLKMMQHSVTKTLKTAKDNDVDINAQDLKDIAQDVIDISQANSKGV